VISSDLQRVSAKKPCPICKKMDWCGFSADGVWAVCMRVQSDKPTRNGGFLHRLKDAPPPPMRRVAPPPPRPKLLDMGAYHAALRKRWTPEQLGEWGEVLGVWEFALDALQPAWDPAAGAVAFPMRDGEGKITGIRLRAADGRKWAVRGGTDGLFYDPGMGPVQDLVVCEGPTDTAAALSLQLPAVGRPSCLGAVEELKALCFRLRVRSLTIVADHDEPHQREDGSIWFPGMEGAVKLIGQMKRMARIVQPPAKDLRQWFREGATREQFDLLARNASWRLS
jgi:hypothetical protein